MPKSTLEPTNEELGVFGLFKGTSGAGKSVGALSFPDPYLLDLDKKMPGIAHKHFPGKEIHWDTFPDMFKLAECLEALQGNCPYETVILDSITSLTQLILSSISTIKGEEVPKLLAKVKKTASGGKMIEMIGFDHYNAETVMVKFVLDVLKNIWTQPGNPKHVIVIGHVLTKESVSPTGIITRTNSIVTAGKAVAAYIPAQFDEAWHFAINAPEFGSTGGLGHVVLTEAIGDEFAKTAFNLPARIDFTRGSLYDKVKDALLVKTPREASRFS